MKGMGGGGNEGDGRRREGMKGTERKGRGGEKECSGKTLATSILETTNTLPR